MTGNREPKPRGNTRQRILDAARRFFARDGYAGTRLDDIANAVDIRRPSLFHHFKDKPTLYKAVWDQTMAEQDDYLAQFFNQPEIPPEKLLDIAIDAWVDYAFGHRDFIYLSLFAAASGRAGDFPRGISTATIHRWQQLIDRGVVEGVFNDVPLVDCMALIGGMTSFYLVTPDNNIPALKRSYQGDRDVFAERLKLLMRALLMKTPSGGSARVIPLQPKP